MSESFEVGLRLALAGGIIDAIESAQAVLGALQSALATSGVSSEDLTAVATAASNMEQSATTPNAVDKANIGKDGHRKDCEPPAFEQVGLIGALAGASLQARRGSDTGLTEFSALAAHTRQRATQLTQPARYVIADGLVRTEGANIGSGRAGAVPSRAPRDGAGSSSQIWSEGLPSAPNAGVSEASEPVDDTSEDGISYADAGQQVPSVSVAPITGSVAIPSRLVVPSLFDASGSSSRQWTDSSVQSVGVPSQSVEADIGGKAWLLGAIPVTGNDVSAASSGVAAVDQSNGSAAPPAQRYSGNSGSGQSAVSSTGVAYEQHFRAIQGIAAQPIAPHLSRDSADTRPEALAADTSGEPKQIGSILRTPASIAASSWAERGGGNPSLRGREQIERSPGTSQTATQQQESSSVAGDVFLDGAVVGRWITRLLSKEAERATTGPTGFDIRRGRLLPGPTVGL